MLMTLQHGAVYEQIKTLPGLGTTCQSDFVCLLQGLSSEWHYDVILLCNYMVILLGELLRKIAGGGRRSSRRPRS